MSEHDEYILGTDTEELQRLRFQHKAWVEQAYALFERGGLRAGDAVLDLGCGPGYTSFELADVVGPTGRVIASDISERFLAFLDGECARRGLDQVETRLGSVEELDLPEGGLDAAYARWLFCWLPDPGAVLADVARALRPGGVILLQEYLDWGALKLVPRSEVVDDVVLACMRSWELGEGSINIADDLPVLARAAGLVVEHMSPVARLGRAGSLEWRWIGGFFASYLPRLVERGLIDATQLQAWREEWKRRSEDECTSCYTPVMADVVLRKPATGPR